MIRAINEAATAALHHAQSPLEMRRIGDALISLGVGVWIAILDGQGIPRDEAIGRIVRKVKAMAEEVSQAQPKQLDS